MDMYIPFPSTCYFMLSTRLVELGIVSVGPNFLILFLKNQSKFKSLLNGFKKFAWFNNVIKNSNK